MKHLLGLFSDLPNTFSRDRASKPIHFSLIRNFL